MHLLMIKTDLVPKNSRLEFYESIHKFYSIVRKTVGDELSRNIPMLKVAFHQAALVECSEVEVQVSIRVKNWYKQIPSRKYTWFFDFDERIADHAYDFLQHLLPSLEKYYSGPRPLAFTQFEFYSDESLNSRDFNNFKERFQNLTVPVSAR